MKYSYDTQTYITDKGNQMTEFEIRQRGWDEVAKMRAWPSATIKHSMSTWDWGAIEVPTTGYIDKKPMMDELRTMVELEKLIDATTEVTT